MLDHLEDEGRVGDRVRQCAGADYCSPEARRSGEPRIDALHRARRLVGSARLNAAIEQIADEVAAAAADVYRRPDGDLAPDVSQQRSSGLLAEICIVQRLIAAVIIPECANPVRGPVELMRNGVCVGAGLHEAAIAGAFRSEERRVGKEGRWGWE